jgi:hypothetical protein
VSGRTTAPGPPLLPGASASMSLHMLDYPQAQLQFHAAQLFLRQMGGQFTAWAAEKTDKSCLLRASAVISDLGKRLYLLR